MGIDIAQKQDRLEEEHGRGPDGGRAANLRQDHAGVEGLNEEQQKRAEQDRQREKRGQIR